MTIEVLRDIFKTEKETTINKRQFEELNSQFKKLESYSSMSSQMLRRKSQENKDLHDELAASKESFKQIKKDISL